MIIYLQWAMAVPQDWTAVNVTRDQQIRAAAKKAEPTGNETLDNNPGWLFGANCQGIDFSGFDHTAIEVLQGDGLRITVWQDDPEDWGDSRLGIRWDLLPPAFDPRVNQINTRQTMTIWATPDEAQRYTEHNVTVFPWSEFTLPPANQTFHGIWVTNPTIFQQHFDIRTLHGWREWI